MELREWSFEELCEIIETKNGEEYNPNPFLVYNDIQIEYARAGMSILSHVVNENSRNYRDAMHGGLIFTMGDSAAGGAIRTIPGSYVTLDANMNFIANAGVGHKVYAVGQVLHRGRTTLVAEVYVISDVNKVLARGRYTFFKTGDEPDTQLIKIKQS